MSAPKHTPTPWRAIKWSCHAATSIVADTDPAEPLVVGGQTVAQYGLTEIADCNGSRREGGDEANAAHIVACVNFLAGIPTEKLDSTLLERLLTVEAERDRLQARLDTNRCNSGHETLPLTLWDCPACHEETKRQRDKLRAAVEMFLEYTEEPPERNCSCHLSPPCNDCVEFSALREAFQAGRDALKEAP